MNQMTTVCLLNIVCCLVIIQPTNGFAKQSRILSTENGKNIYAKRNDGHNAVNKLRNSRERERKGEREITRLGASWLDEIDKSSTSTALSPLEKVQQGFLALTENIPKPVLVTVIAVASGLFFFELSKAILLLSLPIILILGGAQVMPACVCVCVCACIYLSACLSVYLSVCLTVCLSVCLSLFLSLSASNPLSSFLLRRVSKRVSKKALRVQGYSIQRYSI
jgi:hypothetical protein